MAMFDYLMGEDRIPGAETAQAGFENIQAPVVPEVRQPEMNWFEQIASNPNLQRWAAHAGQLAGQGKPPSEWLGVPTEALVRRRAAQQTGEGLVQQIVNALRQGDPNELVGSPEDMGTFNSIKMDNKGTTFTMPRYTPEKPKFSIGAEQPLEAIRSMQTPEVPAIRTGMTADRGQDLPGFLRGLLG